MVKSLALFLFFSTLASAATSNPPCLASLDAPNYPQLAKTARIQGAVVLKIKINEQGNVTSATSVSGHPILKDAAIANVRTWRFTQPADGKPVEMEVTYKYIIDEAGRGSPCPNFRVYGASNIEIYNVPYPVLENTSKTK